MKSLLKESVGVFLYPVMRSLSSARRIRSQRSRVAHDGYKLQDRAPTSSSTHMTQLIDFYKNTKVADSVLTVPPMYRAKFDFKVDPSDPQLCGMLTAPRWPDWWHVAEAARGESGLVPAIYLSLSGPSASRTRASFRALRQLSFPIRGAVARERNPNIFDPNQLRLETGDIVEVQAS
uniref:SH3 domain-containing protein n=1 Tax=Macrostomum lignano TaxID=282301 RepID=A0A1I8F5T7_9PLAT